ncbi:hypothetical protein BDV06DRAFT_194360 [Aspergillus oleicola]
MSNYVPPSDGLATQHDGSEEIAVHNTLFNRLLTLLALKTTAKFCSQCGSCIRISRKRIVKTGPWVHLTEAATMKFVSDNTPVPVPKVYCSFVRKIHAYIVIKRVDGQEVPSAWGKLNGQPRQQIFDELRSMMKELRALKPPKGSRVSSCVGESLRGSRIPRSRPRLGPFDSIQDFLWLREGM